MKQNAKNDEPFSLRNDKNITSNIHFGNGFIAIAKDNIENKNREIISSLFLNNVCYWRKRGLSHIIIDSTDINLDLNWFKRKISKKMLEDQNLNGDTLNIEVIS